MDLSGYIGISMWAVAIGTLVFVIGLGIVLAYHWRRYSMNGVIAMLALSIYVIVSGLLLLSMFAAAIAYTV